jgi:hypothetical protein
MNRRKFLVLTETAGVCALSGCSALTGGDNTDESTTPRPTLVKGPAQFTDFKIEAPKKVTVDETVPVTVSAFNYGTTAGSFSGSIITVEGASTVSKRVRLTDVKPGQREKTTIDLSVSIADEYILGISESSSATTRITVGPKEAAVGESFDLMFKGETGLYSESPTMSPLRVTLTDVEYRPSIYYQYSSGYGGAKTTNLFSTTDEQTLAILQFEVENTGTEEVTFSSKPFTVSNGTVFTDIRDHDLSGAIDIKGHPLVNSEVKAGQRLHGWFLTQMSRTQAKKGAIVGWQQDVHKTPIERAWNIKPTKLPSFSLKNWSLDTKQALGRYSYSFTVKNTGAVKGRFRGILDYKPTGKGSDAWSPFQKLNASIPPGKSKTITVNNSWRYLQDIDYRVRPFDTVKSVTFQVPKLSFGEEAVIPGGDIRVSNFHTRSSYKTQGYGGITTVKANENFESDQKHTFAFVHVDFSLHKYRDTSLDMTKSGRFSLRANNKTYEDGPSEPIVGPLDGHFYGSDPKPQNGWIAFEVPANVNASNATIVFENEYGGSLYQEGNISKAEWSKGD